MKSLNEVFAKNLKDFRIKAGLSQEELAIRSGLHRTYIGSVERGERNISLHNVERIANALGMEPVLMLTKQDGAK